jgi:capsular polysaccharide biosynthesis protein
LTAPDASGSLGVPALRLERFVGPASPIAQQVRSDIELVTVRAPERVAVTAPVTGDLTDDAVAGEYASRPVLVAALSDALVAPQTGIVLTSRDELVHEVHANDQLVATVAATSDLAAWAADRPSAQRLGEAHLVLGNVRLPNYYHWWFDSLSRIWLTDVATPWAGCPIVVGGALAPLERACLDALGLQDRTVAVEPERVSLNVAIVSNGLAYGSAMRMSPLTSEFARWARERLDPPRSGSRRLLVSRARAAVRRVTNEAEIATALSAGGFELLCLEDLDVAAQARAFAEAEIVVAPHGAGLTNLLFATPGTGVVELFSGEGAHDSVYRRLASLLDHPYAAVVGETIPGARTSHRADMRIDPDHLVSIVAAVAAARGSGGR